MEDKRTEVVDVSQPAKQSQQRYILVRLITWLAIYMIGPVVIASVGHNSAFLWAFPSGLFLAVCILVKLVVPKSGDIFGEFGASWSCLGLCYIVYLGHLILSLRVRSTKAFRLLMVVLIILVALNTASCLAMLNSKVDDTDDWKASDPSELSSSH